MSNGKGKASITKMFSIAFVWFGIHVGSGFATGNQINQFYVKYGWPCIFLPMISMLILGFAFYNGSIFALRERTYHYRAFSDKFYAPFHKVLSVVFEITYFAVLITATSAVIAGAASLANSIINMPYLVGVYGFALILLVFSIFGPKVIMGLSSIFSIVIIIMSVIIIAFGLAKGAPMLAVRLAEAPLPQGLGTPIWRMLTYAGFQAVSIAALTAVFSDDTVRANAKGGILIGTILNGVMLTLMSIMLFCFPDALKETIPTLAIINSTGHTSLTVAYSIMLLMAFLSTAVPLIFAVVSRFEAIWKNGKGVFEKSKNKRILLAFVTIGICLSFSFMGLTKIIAVGYGYTGIVMLFIFVIPAIFLPLTKLKKKLTSNQENDQTPTTTP